MMQGAYVLMHVSGLKFLETQSLTTHSRCYLHMAYPLKNRLALQGLQENYSRSRSYPHVLKHQRVPSGSTYGCSPHEALGLVAAL